MEICGDGPLDLGESMMSMGYPLGICYIYSCGPFIVDLPFIVGFLLKLFMGYQLLKWDINY